jgi:hypothetical protein
MRRTCRDTHQLWQRSQKPLRRGLLLGILFFSVFSSMIAVFADSTDVVHVTVQPGDTLVVSCSRYAVQGVYVHGNLSQVELGLPKKYPSSDLSLVAKAPGNLNLAVSFYHTQPYQVEVTVLFKSGNTREIDSFYLSDGSFNLSIALSVTPLPMKASESHLPSGKDFSNWFVHLGEAFPLWTKLLYLLLGLQFIFVGYEKTVFDAQCRRERKLRPLDLGNMIYLFLDVVCRFLVTCFAITAVVMMGEVIVLTILRLIFLVTIDLPSIWNLSVLAVLALITISLCLLRIVLRHKFDLDPVEVV